MRRRLVLALLFGVLVLTGCGSSASNSADSARFATQLDTLCTQGNAAVRGTHSISAAADTFQGYLDKVKALTPPDRLKPTFSKFTSLLDQRLALYRQRKLAAAKQLHQPISALATQMGAAACAK